MTAVDADDLQVQARALGDPTRYRIFRHIADSAEPVGVRELTDELGLNHNAIRQHLAQLVAADLVVESVAPPEGRGRPPLNYAVHPNADSRWGVLGPYERLSLWLTEMVRTGDSAFEVGRRVGRRHRSHGTAAVDPAEEIVDQMALNGFEPTSRRRGNAIEITLTSCPFASTALVAPDTVCELHRGIAAGVAESVGGIVVDELVRKDPRRANCRLRCHLDPDAGEVEA
jgi:predicted ArsR family transcriptional regulator